MGDEVGKLVPVEKLLTRDARALLDSAIPGDGPPPDVEATRRADREQARAFGGEPEPLATVQDLTAAGVPARLYSDAEAAARLDSEATERSDRPALVWFHGGGWTTGDLGTHDCLARALARHAGCDVLSVDYRLAPEHRYPAAIDDAWAATRWAAARFERIAVGGDSAGANLAAAVTLRAREADLDIVHQLLVYPVLDPGLDSPYVEDFVAEYGDFGGWHDFGATVRAGIGLAWAAYVPDPALRREPDAAPARAASLAGLPSATFVFAEHDILRDEGEIYAERLAAAGVAAQIVRYPGQIHGFYHLLAMADARAAVDVSAAALQDAFGTGA